MVVSLKTTTKTNASFLRNCVISVFFKEENPSKSSLFGRHWQYTHFLAPVLLTCPSSRQRIDTIDPPAAVYLPTCSERQIKRLFLDSDPAVVPVLSAWCWAHMSSSVRMDGGHPGILHTGPDLWIFCMLSVARPASQSGHTHTHKHTHWVAPMPIFEVNMGWTMLLSSSEKNPSS